MTAPSNGLTAHPTLSEDDPIPISLVVHQAFCPRRAWLEVMGEHTDTAQVATGTIEHGGTDDETTSRTTRLRGVDVRSDRLGICGRCDTLEVGADGVTVVEYKATPVRRKADVTPPMRAQLALQGIALGEMGYQVAGHAVYFTQHRTRVDVPLTAQDVAEAEALVADVRKTAQASTAPPPLEDDPRCTRCSHVAVCLPDERHLAPVAKRILVPSPDGQVLHLATPGSRASIRQGRVEVSHRGERSASIPIEQVQAVVAHGNIDLSGGLIRELLWRGIVVIWCSSGGRVVGWAASAASPNGGPRHRQHVEAEHGRLDLAREFVAGKIANQATLLRRHGEHPETVMALRELQRQAERAASLNELFGIEGDAAARYFAGFPSMFKADSVVAFHGRTRRPATDPLNAALNYAYALLVADVTRAVLACGLDPHGGFLHSPERNKPALALDLCEEFRAPVADSVVLGAFNNGELSGKDFSAVLGAVSLRDKGRKQLIAAYERRVGQEFKHPTYGYAVTWRRAMEIQARMVLGVVDGTQPRYRSIRVR
jgi:CRISPR-associated protein Cas1